jgi:hypothetical protein
MNLPFAFGSAGGGVTIKSDGTALLCDVGCGKPAVSVFYGLNLCLNCERNLHLAENQNSIQLNPTAVKTFLIANKATNLSGR